MNNKLKVKIIIVVLVILVGFYVFNNRENDNFDNEEIYVDSSETVETVSNSVSVETIEKIKIHIIGEVNNPGIYELEIGARIEDAIIAAGGESNDADLNKVNLAYELEDGQKIDIPSIFDEENAYIYSDAGTNVLIQQEGETSMSGKINVNKASLEELQQIRGIGPALAEKIIAYREETGKFQTVEDLKNVSGIGDKKYETIKEYIEVK